MASDIKQKLAKRLKALIGDRPVLDLVRQGGPSKSYIYRLLAGKGNPSVEELESLVRAYGGSLGEFFEPWKEEERLARQHLAVEIRTRLEKVLDSDVDLNGLVAFLRVLDPGETRKNGKSR